MAQKKTTKTPRPKKIINSTSQKVRKLPTSRYKSFRLQKSIKSPKSKLPSGFNLLKSSIRLLLRNWRLFAGIIIIFIILDIALVKGLSSGTNIPELKQNMQELFSGSLGQLTTGLTIFSLLLGSAGSVQSELANSYQIILFILISLALIWSLRQVLAKKKTTVKNAFYNAMHPLIPFLLVLIVICLQLIPLLVVSFLYGLVFGKGLAVTAPEKSLWVVLLFLISVLSLYMMTSSVFALYIVTLPDMTPMKALRSARELVRYRRWTIMRKILFLPFSLFIIAALITVPVILLLTPLAEAIFFILTTLALPVVHSYMYSLYRELL